MSPVPRWDVRPEPPDGPQARELLHEYVAELARRTLGRPANEAELARHLRREPPEDLAPPRGLLLVATAPEGAPAGCVGVRRLPEAPGSAELRRLYVRPEERGLGLGRLLLGSAEEAAVRLGARRMVAEHHTLLTEARALWLGHGYRETAPYPGHGQGESWFARELSGSPGE
ncbi:GNAT family N-acetyltransferase [Streptomyces sp. NPDC005438]|uniref:GNAT family N-acetyltransferase n=1 Tax=Streptomyces sp. NPDC005438 TaxID=3156880 RepID=UPI0033B42C7A